MTRMKLSKIKRVKIFDAGRGICHLCGLPIQAGQKWEADHVKPLWCGGEDHESNMAPAHVKCHSDKSKADAAPKAKTDRQRANHLGIKANFVKKIQSRGFTKHNNPSKIGNERIVKQSLPPRNVFVGG